MAYDGADDWMVEGVAQFLRCPLWTGPVHNFIDDNCALFGDCQDQAQGGQRSTGHTVEHKRLHDEFRELVDSKLTTYIDELGVDAARLLEVCQQTTHPAGKQLLEYVTALDRFETFVQILTKRNHELELEALEQLRRLQAASQGDAPTPLRPDAPSTEDVEAETDAERLAREEEEMIAKAIAASLQTTEVTQKQAEVEDDELQKALQVSLAFEESRLAAAKAEAEAEAQQKADEAAAAVKEAARVEAEKQAAAAAQAKADDAAKAVAAAEAKAAAEEMAAAEAAAAKAKAEAEAVAAAKAKELEEESRARQEKLNEETLAARRENAAKAHEAPAPTPAPTPAEAPPKAPLAAESGKPALAPLAVRSLPPLGGNSGASFGTRTKLPDIAPSSAPSQPTQLAPQPAFAELVSQASPASPQPTSGPTEEELKQRAAYMKAQRDKILAQKKKERATEMADYVAKQPDAPAGAAKPTTDEAHQKLSVELARRFRADIVRNASS